MTVLVGALAVVAEDDVAVTDDVGLTTVPVRFRFCDENPLRLESYAVSRFEELPPYIGDVVVTALGLIPTGWNALVVSGGVSRVVDLHEWFSLAEWLAAEVVRRRGGGPVKGVLCGDCWGTLVEFDADGSITGTVGTAVLCYCTGV